MSQITIRVPRVNDSSSDFGCLFGIAKEVEGYSDVTFDFTLCGFLRPNAIAFIGGLSRRIQDNGGIVRFNWPSICDSVLAVLSQNGFANCFGHSSTGWDGNAIPYREDRDLNMNQIMDYLSLNWIGKGWISVSERLKNAISERMWEVYDNAFEHSGSQVGVYSCGQYFPHNNELILSVVDFGHGIPAKIRTFFGDNPKAKNLLASRCLKWAFTSGKSTCDRGIPRGLGLDLMKEFVQINQGKLEIYSNEGYVLVHKDGEVYNDLGLSFDGTIVHITLKCDESLYCFKDEMI